MGSRIFFNGETLPQTKKPPAAVFSCAPTEIRTPVLTLKGLCPGPLDDGGIFYLMTTGKILPFQLNQVKPNGIPGREESSSSFFRVWVKVAMCFRLINMASLLISSSGYTIDRTIPSKIGRYSQVPPDIRALKSNLPGHSKDTFIFISGICHGRY